MDVEVKFFAKKLLDEMNENMALKENNTTFATDITKK